MFGSDGSLVFIVIGVLIGFGGGIVAWDWRSASRHKHEQAEIERMRLRMTPAERYTVQHAGKIWTKYAEKVKKEIAATDGE